MSPLDRFKHENIILETLWCTKIPIIIQNQIDDWINLKTGINIQTNDKESILKHFIIGSILDYIEFCKVYNDHVKLC